jgi:predicted 3-demethylubiquinone-9 3-methyltransferase (glyoxalase superfamily)
MPKSVPCLWFDTEGEAAAEFYTSVFPNSEILNVSRYGPGGMRPEGLAMTVTFTVDGQEYMALNGGPEFTFSEAISFMIPCETQDEADRYWYALTEGGQESQCGWLKDRFGVSWQIVPTGMFALLSDPDPERAARAMTAMLSMQRIDLAVMASAADGHPGVS